VPPAAPLARGLAGGGSLARLAWFGIAPGGQPATPLPRGGQCRGPEASPSEQRKVCAPAPIMNDLLRQHPDLVEEYLGALELAAAKLLALLSWSEEATFVLLHQPQGGVTLAPIQGLAGLLEPISITGIDTYARLRLEGKGIDEALQARIDHPRR